MAKPSVLRTDSPIKTELINFYMKLAEINIVVRI